MASTKKTKKAEAPKVETPAVNKGWQLKSAGWLVELAFRVFAGIVLLTKFDHVVALAAGFYALGTALVVVGAHIVIAHKK